MLSCASTPFTVMVVLFALSLLSSLGLVTISNRFIRETRTRTDITMFGIATVLLFAFSSYTVF